MGYGEKKQMTLSKRKTERRWSDARLEARKKKLLGKMKPEFILKDWDKERNQK